MTMTQAQAQRLKELLPSKRREQRDDLEEMIHNPEAFAERTVEEIFEKGFRSASPKRSEKSETDR